MNNKIIKSFKFAFVGIWTMLKTQSNARFHVLATILVIVSGFVFGITIDEWCWLILSISIVLTAEAFNTAIEFIADMVSPEYHPLIKNTKDVAAGAVLISAIGAAAIGLLILGPYILKLLK